MYAAWVVSKNKTETVLRYSDYSPPQVSVIERYSSTVSWVPL